MDKTLLARVAALPNMPLSDLKALWRDLYQNEPPCGHKSHIVRRLAYRLQELAYGVDPQIENRIEQQANDLFGSGKKAKPKRKTQYQRPIPGTKLVREYKGIEYQVTILEEGYEYAGCLYKSLSKVALEGYATAKQYGIDRFTLMIERKEVLGQEQWHGVFEYGSKNLKVIGTLEK